MFEYDIEYIWIIISTQLSYWFQILVWESNQIALNLECEAYKLWGLQKK